MSMMKMESSVDKKNKAKYTKKSTATFKIPADFYETLTEEEKKEITCGLVDGMYDDLLKQVSHNDVDSVGVWIDYDGNRYENAMKIQALNEMNEFGAEDVDAVYELFVMTLSKAYNSPIIGDA
jgi:catalase